MISIIIPFRDHINFLKKCISSITKKTSYHDYEVLLVDNKSKKKETLDFLNGLNDSRIKILHYDHPFNFAKINNYASKFAKGSNLLFLNNDTEVISDNWLIDMLACLDDEKIGVVGSSLLYKNNSVQHCGVMLESDKLAIHAFKRWRLEDIPIKGLKEWSAVTGACMLTRAESFFSVGGFDGLKFPTAYNDVDYCLKIKGLGFKVVCNLDVKLYHYESASRGRDFFARFLNRKRYEQFVNEQNNLKNKWGSELANDPFYRRDYR